MGAGHDWRAEPEAAGGGAWPAPGCVRSFAPGLRMSRSPGAGFLCWTSAFARTGYAILHVYVFLSCRDFFHSGLRFPDALPAFSPTRT